MPWACGSAVGAGVGAVDSLPMLTVFEEYAVSLGRWGAYVAFVLVAVSMALGDEAWMWFFVGFGSSTLGLTLSLEDQR